MEPSGVTHKTAAEEEGQEPEQTPAEPSLTSPCKRAEKEVAA